MVTHQRGEDVIRGEGIIDAYLQQASRLRIDGRFPKLVGIHFTQTLVALDALLAARLLEQPSHGVLEAADLVAIVFTCDVGALTNEAREGAAKVRDPLILGGLE